MLGRSEQVVDGRAFDDLAGIHHRDLVADLGDHAEIVGDQNDRGPARRLQLAHQIEDLRLQGDVERGGRLVRDQKPGIAGQRHRDHDALAHAARQFVRIFVDAFFRRGDVDAAQQVDRALARRAPRSAAMAQDGLDDLLADRETRVERGHRLLENHREAVAAQVAQSLVGYLKQVETVETDRSGDLGRMFRQQAHDGQRSYALAAAGFADQPQRRAIGHAEVDAVDGMRGAAVVAVEEHPQIPDFDQRDFRHFCPAMAASIEALMVSRSVMPAGCSRVGRNFRKWTQCSRLTRSSRSSSASGSA